MQAVPLARGSPLGPLAGQSRPSQQLITASTTLGRDPRESYKFHFSQTCEVCLLPESHEPTPLPGLHYRRDCCNLKETAKQYGHQRIIWGAFLSYCPPFHFPFLLLAFLPSPPRVGCCLPGPSRPARLCFWL